MEDLFLKILNMSITGAYVILAVLAVRFLLRKAPKKFSYALWAAAGFRLACPVSFRSVVSLFSLKPFNSAVTQTSSMTFIPSDIVYQTTPQINTGIEIVDQAVNSNLPAATPAASINPIQILILVSMIVWIIGMVIMAGISIVSYIRLKKDLRFAVRLEGNVWQCEIVRSPFILGILNPRIYIPYGLDDRTRDAILAHEQYHLKRLDHMVKVFAFALLTLHWFNPFCHLAFHLMSRDMEMSCDEHVLEEKGIATTEYSESLLTIAMNRRFPAATPLAFAETGVKERMINVLKWRKPRTWVTVIAVLVSILMLVSCMANPNVTTPTTPSPEVGNPAMLEFPGVEWFATPEELKEALNITEDQIITEEIDTPEEDQRWDYDNYYLSVKDLFLFGREVTYALFRFRRDPGYDFGLEMATVMFAEDTNMLALKEDLMAIYGPGAGSEYTYYTYERDHKVYSTRSSKLDETLKYMAKSGYRHIEGLEGNPFKDALESPDYMTHTWSTITGDFLEAEGITDYFKALIDEPYNADQTALQDDKVLEEMLNQFPWITITMGNKCAAAIQRDATGQASDATAYYTNNYIEFNAMVLSTYRHLSK